MKHFRRLDFGELEDRADDYDAYIAATPGVDTYCSTTPWVLSAREAFHGSSEPLIIEVDEGFAAFMVVPTERLGRTAFPLEATWGMASPFACKHPDQTMRVLARALQTLRAEWDTLYVLGLRVGGAVADQLVRNFAGRYRLGQGMKTARCAARLDGGWDGYLSRRTPKFRKNARNNTRRCEAAGVSFVEIRPLDAVSAASVFERVLTIEERSWKGRAGTGIDTGRMRAFYATMFPRLARRGALRVGFAVRDGVDVAYIAGGHGSDGYRGLQISFDDDLRHLALGSYCHLRTIRALCEERVPVYDMGQDMEYKHRWGEAIIETQAIVVL